MSQHSSEHLKLALKVLSDLTNSPEVAPRDIETLRAYLGDGSDDLAPDEVACEVIKQEVKRLMAARAKGAGT